MLAPPENLVKRVSKPKQQTSLSKSRNRSNNKRPKLSTINSVLINVSESTLSSPPANIPPQINLTINNVNNLTINNNYNISMCNPNAYSAISSSSAAPTGGLANCKVKFCLVKVNANSSI
jgi:hypothetical protein